MSDIDTAWEDTSYEVFLEYQRAREKFDPLNSAHEGYAVLLEEVDELVDELYGHMDKLWSEVKKDELVKARAEAVQVVAMAMAFIIEVCDA